MSYKRNAVLDYDIMIRAYEGYDGVVEVNGSRLQLIHVNGTDLWVGNAPSTVTAMDYFLRAEASDYGWNTTARYVKSVEFGTRMYSKTSGLTTLRRAFSFSGVAGDIYLNRVDFTNINTSSVTDMQGMFSGAVTVEHIDHFPAIQNGTNTGTAFIELERLTTISSSGDIREGFSIVRSHLLTLSSAKVILRALKTVSSETLNLPYPVWAKIYEDDEALSLVTQAKNRGWSFNEPDIIVVADQGYNGVVRVNGADKTLTQSSSDITGDSGVWYGTAPSSVTAMDYFMKHASASAANYNSTSSYIKKVMFGTGMKAKTASLTTLAGAFACNNNTDVSRLELIDVTNITTSNVTNMNSAFGFMLGNNSVTIKGYEDFDVSKVTDFNYCFASGCIKHNIDLHKWHTLSNASSAYLSLTLATAAQYAANPAVFYTPAYWKSPVPQTVRIPLTVYPYHDITVAGNSSYTGAATINENNTPVTQLTQDSTLGIWYYDFPSGGMLKNLGHGFRNNILSVSMKDSCPQDETNGIDMQSCISRADSLTSIYFPVKKVKSNLGWFADFGSATGAIKTIHGMGSFTTAGNIYTTCLVRSNPSIRYVDFAPMNGFSSQSNQPFYGCTNLVRIKNFPGMQQDDTNVCYNCTSLTTIDNCGPISATVSFANSPLSLDSAKVILRALQTVTSKTITFSSTTLNYIFQDDDALELVRQAKLKGWNVANTNRLITGTVTSGTTSIKLRINNDSSKDVTVTCTNGRFAYNVTEDVTIVRNLLSQTTAVTSIDFSNCDLSHCTSMLNAFLDKANLTKVSLKGCDTSNVTNWQGCFGNQGNSVLEEIDLSGCTIANGSTINYLFLSQSTLTTVITDEHTSINQTFNMAQCSSLSLQSAKNVLSALGTVSKTASFHDTTQDKIAGDYEAKMLLAQARQRGWTIAVASTIRGTVTSSTSSISLKINGSSVSVSCSSGAFTYRTTNTITSLNQFLYDNRTILTIDMHQMDLYSCTNMGDMFNTAMSLTSAIVKELDTRNVTTMYAMFNYCPPLASLDVSKLDTRSVTNFTYFSGYNGNITSLSELPAIYSGADTSNMFVSCGGLVSIDSVGDGGIAATLDMSSCPLSLESAKVILQALQTVEAETLTFSATTIGYINADSEALSLVTAARNKGWTISL